MVKNHKIDNGVKIQENHLNQLGNFVLTFVIFLSKRFMNFSDIFNEYFLLIFHYFDFAVMLFKLVIFGLFTTWFPMRNGVVG